MVLRTKNENCGALKSFIDNNCRRPKIFRKNSSIELSVPYQASSNYTENVSHKPSFLEIYKSRQFYNNRYSEPDSSAQSNFDRDSSATPSFFSRPSRQRAQTGPAAPPHCLQSQIDAVKAADNFVPCFVSSFHMMNSDALQRQNSSTNLEDIPFSMIKHSNDIHHRWVNVLREMFRDLAFCSDRKGRTLNRDTFLNYFPLPGVLGERLFDLFDTDSSQTIDFHEFFLGLSVIYNGTPNDRKKLLFDLYDLDGNGYITREEVTALLTHIPAALKILQGLRGAHTSQLEQQETPRSSAEKSPAFYALEPKINGRCVDDTKISIESQSDNKAVNCSDQQERQMEGPELDDAIDSIVTSIFTKAGRSTNEDDKKKGLTFQEFCEAVDKSAELSEVFNLFFDIGMPDLPVPSNTLAPRFLLDRSARHLLFGGNVGRPFNLCWPKTLSSKSLLASSGTPLKHNSHDNTHRQNKVSQLETNDDTISRESYTFCPVSTAIYFDERFKNSDAGSDFKTNLDFHNISPTVVQVSENKLDVARAAEDLVVSGWLYKFGRRFNIKLYRFYIIRDRFLYYFKKTKNSAPKKVIFLQGATILPVCDTEKVNSFAFDIVLPNNRLMRLYAHGRKDRNVWVNTLIRASRTAHFHDDYILHEPLGRGHFAIVHRGECRHSQKTVAVKILKKKDFEQKDKGFLRNEITALTLLRHPNIVQLIDIYDGTELLYLVMEWVSSGDVWSLVNQLEFHVDHKCICPTWFSNKRNEKPDAIITKHIVSEYFARIVAHGTLQGLSCLHRHNVIHRDLKPENILMITAKNETKEMFNCECETCSICQLLKNLTGIKITDFGLAKILPPHLLAHEPIGTLSYAAPEVIQEQPYCSGVDIWALGVLTYQILSGGRALPFQGKTECELAKKIVHGTFDLRPQEQWDQISNNAKNFVSLLMQPDPAFRPTAAAALTHPWLTKGFRNCLKKNRNNSRK